MIVKTALVTPLGDMTAAMSDGGFSGLWFTRQKYYPRDAETWESSPEEPLFLQVQDWLNRYFAGENPAVEFLLAPAGTPFQMEVWDILRSIPYGKTVTYGDIAKVIARRRDEERFSAQAVGGAVGHNPISLVIPCHRVIGADGALTGYAGGIERKTALLALEGGAHV